MYERTRKSGTSRRTLLAATAGTAAAVAVGQSPAQADSGDRRLRALISRMTL